MKVIPASTQARSERGIFRQETVSGMNCIAAGITRDAENFFNYQIAFAGGSRANRVGFVRQTNVQRCAIHVAVHRDGAHAQFPASALDAHGNLAAIGNQYLAKH